MIEDLGEHERIKEAKRKLRSKLLEFDLNRKQRTRLEMTKLASVYKEWDLAKKFDFLYAVGYDMSRIEEGRFFLDQPLQKLMLKCEIALLEQTPIDTFYLEYVHCNELVTVYGARERGFLPANWNILSGCKKASKKVGMSKNDFAKSFYNKRTLKKLHQNFTEQCPEFYEFFCEFPEYNNLVASIVGNTPIKSKGIDNYDFPRESKMLPTPSNICYSTDKTFKENMKERGK